MARGVRAPRERTTRGRGSRAGGAAKSPRGHRRLPRFAGYSARSPPSSPDEASGKERTTPEADATRGRRSEPPSRGIPSRPRRGAGITPGARITPAPARKSPPAIGTPLWTLSRTRRFVSTVVAFRSTFLPARTRTRTRRRPPPPSPPPPPRARTSATKTRDPRPARKRARNTRARGGGFPRSASHRHRAKKNDGRAARGCGARGGGDEARRRRRRGRALVKPGKVGGTQNVDSVVVFESFARIVRAASRGLRNALGNARRRGPRPRVRTRARRGTSARRRRRRRETRGWTSRGRGRSGRRRWRRFARGGAPRGGGG